MPSEDATSPGGPGAPHRARAVAESFGADPERYDRTRPRYPRAMVERIVAASPGPELLDVGCGTGISARAFQRTGCRVLGVEVDERMAAFARRRGLEVEVARFEDWDPAGRSFDAIVSGMTWHWIDPVAGPARAAEVLRPGGRLAAFWYLQQPPDALARAFSDVYRRVLPDTPFAGGPAQAVDAYAPILDRAADGIAADGAFERPEQWRFGWERRYTRGQWLDQVPTSGGHSRFAPDTLDALLSGLGSAIDAAKGSFTMECTAVVVTARRRSR